MDRTAFSRALLGGATLLIACRGNETPGQSFERLKTELPQVYEHSRAELERILEPLLAWISTRTWDDWLAMGGWAALAFVGVLVFHMLIRDTAQPTNRPLATLAMSLGLTWLVQPMLISICIDTIGFAVPVVVGGSSPDVIGECHG